MAHLDGIAPDLVEMIPLDPSAACCEAICTAECVQTAFPSTFLKSESATPKILAALLEQNPPDVLFLPSWFLPPLFDTAEWTTVTPLNGLPEPRIRLSRTGSRYRA